MRIVQLGKKAAAGMFMSLLAIGGCPQVPSDNPAGLTSKDVFTLTNGKAVGTVAVSPNGNTLAFSDGGNIFTLDLTNPSATPVQVTSNLTSAFAPNFLANGDLVFGSINPAQNNQIDLLMVNPAAASASPQLFRTITASDLGL